MNKTFLALVFLALIGIPSCAPKRTLTKYVVVPIEEPQEFQVKIIEGKTTKQEVIDALGMPKSLSSSNIDYDFNNDRRICKLMLVQKDGTMLNVILGKRKKYQYHTLALWFNSKKPSVIDSVQLL